ncbi:unnamed protein product, partial [Prorocentrum cordatum]
PHWCCGQCGRAENWACRIQCLCGRDAPAAILSRARQKHKDADAGGGGGKKAGFKQGGPATQGIPKQLAEWMQAIEKRLAPPDKEWPKPGGTAPWREAADGADPDKKSQSAKLGERITELEGCLPKLPPADERNKDLRGPIEKQLETLRTEKRALLSPQALHRRTQQDLQRARNGLEKLEKESGEQERQLEELAKGIATRKETIAAKKLEVAALGAAFSESAKNVTTVAADIDLVEDDVADQPDLVALLKPEAWVKLKSAVASKVQKRALYHARSEGSIDDFMSAFDTMWSELAAKPTVGAEFSIETYNASGGKASVKKRLANTMASVVLLQEFVHISEHVEVVPNRVQNVLIDTPELPVGLHAFNVYLHTGEGAAGRNGRLLQELGLAAEALGGPVVIGGDWNMCPGELEASQFPAHVGDAEHVKRLVYTVAPKMGTQIIIGPQVQPPTYASARCVAEAAVQSRGDPESPPGVGWGLFSAARGHFAVAAAGAIANAVGHPDRRVLFGFARYLQPRWADVTNAAKDASDLQAEAEGWQWLKSSLLSIMQCKTVANPAVPDLSLAAEEIFNFATANYHGQGLAARLDRSVQQARGVVQAGFEEEACRELLGDIEPDVKLAVNGATQEDRQKWKEWCAM